MNALLFSSGFLGQTTLVCARLRIWRVWRNIAVSLHQSTKERWLSVAEIAAHLNVNSDTFYEPLESK
jgi:hypothetical protein